MRNLRGVVAALVLGLAWLGSAWPQDPAGPAPAVSGPLAFMQAHDQVVQRLLQANPSDSLPPAAREALKRQINAVFDFRELGRLALGAYWDRRTEAERNAFVKLFTDIIEEKNLDSFLRYYREGRFNYQGEVVALPKATVRAVVPLKKEKVNIEYLMHQVGGQWRVYDLVIDDVSTADGYQRQYTRYIEKYSYEKLIDQLGKQLDRLRSS